MTPPPMNEGELESHPYADHYRAAGRHEKAALLRRGTLKKLVPMLTLLTRITLTNL